MLRSQLLLVIMGTFLQAFQVQRDPPGSIMGWELRQNPKWMLKPATRGHSQIALEYDSKGLHYNLILPNAGIYTLSAQLRQNSGNRTSPGTIEYICFGRGDKLSVDLSWAIPGDTVFVDYKSKKRMFVIPQGKPLLTDDAN